MQFEKGYIYHIYNQGNNRRKIFFNRGNYLFFIKKIRTYVKPYADILAWCLMPNHFHLMVLVNELELPVGLPSIGEGANSIGEGANSIGVVPNNTDAINNPNTKMRSFNHSIGIMLRSYSQAVNRQQNFSGKLIREKTKAECVNCPQPFTPSFLMIKGITTYLNPDGSKDYPQTCFRYIHQNPVKAGLVNKAIEWEYSSAKDYAKLRKGSLVNYELTNKYILSTFSKKDI